MFSKAVLEFESEPEQRFKELSTSTEFEDITKGRKGAILVDYRDELVPIVRTTTKYSKPVQKFLPIHYDIIDRIKNSFSLDTNFNNAMIEIYDSRYHKMGFHTDQSLDLEEDSYICLYSCYKYHKPEDTRKLKIKNKLNGEFSEVMLDQDSAVLFSTSVNKVHQHKIVLEPYNDSTNEWLGITFRLSKTFIRFEDDLPYIFPTDRILKMANEEERINLYRSKKAENNGTDYKYPDIDYTISESDLMPISR